MAKIKLPLMSLEASGSIAQFLTFSKRNSGQQVRWQMKQSDVLTSERIEQRRKFLLASLSARFYGCGYAMCGATICGFNLTDLNLEAAGKPLSGYNLAIKQNIEYV